MEIFSVDEEVAAALDRGDDAAVLRLLTDVARIERRVRESIDALLTDLAFVLRLAPTPLANDAQLILPSGTYASRDLLVLLETLLELQYDALSADRAPPLFPLLFDWFYWFDPSANARVDEPASRHHPHYERWVEAERLSRAAPPGTPSPALWLRRLPPVAARDPIRTCFGIPGTLRERSRDERRLLVACDLALYERSEGRTLGGPIMTEPARIAAYHDDRVSLYALDRIEPIAELPPAAAPIRQMRFVDRNRALLTATANDVHAWHSVDGAPLGAAGPGPLRQLLPLDHGPTILHHPSGSRLFDQTKATPVGLSGPVSSSVTFTQGKKKDSYNLNRNATRELRLVDGDSGRVLLGLVLAGRMQIEAPSTDLSPDGARVLVWNRGRAQLWSTETLAPIAALPAFGDSINMSISAVEFSNDSELCFIANGNTLFWFAASDAQTRGELRFAGSDDKPDARLDYVRLARAGERSVLLYAGTAWHFVNPAIGTLGPAMTIGYHYPPVVAPDGTFVVLLDSKSMRVHSLPDGALRFEVKTYSHDVGIAADGATIELRNERSIKRFDAVTGEELALREAPPVEQPASRIHEPRDRNRIRIDTGALTTSVRLLVVPEPRLPNTRVRFLGGDGRHLLTEHESGLRLWDLATGRAALDWAGERVVLTPELMAGEPPRVLIRRGDELVLRELTDGRALWRRALRLPDVERASLSRDGRTFLIEAKGGGLVALDAASGDERYVLADAKVHKHCARHVVVTLAGQANTIVEIESGRTIAVLPGERGVYGVSRDGEWALRPGAYSHCEIWRLDSQQLVTTFEYEGGTPYFLEEPVRVQTFESISPQSGNTDTDIWREYEVPSGRLLRTRSEDVYGYGFLDRARTPGTLAPGVVLESDGLVVDGTRLSLDANQAVGVGLDGTIYVATETALFDLFAIERSRKSETP